jgi:hypothetical protein
MKKNSSWPEGGKIQQEGGTVGAPLLAKINFLPP